MNLNRFKGQEFDAEWWKLRNEWRVSLLRDDLKRIAFKNNNKYGYYLIEVDNNIKPGDRVNHILEEIFKQTGIDLSYLSVNVKMNEILNRIL